MSVNEGEAYEHKTCSFGLPDSMVNGFTSQYATSARRPTISPHLIHMCGVEQAMACVRGAFALVLVLGSAQRNQAQSAISV